MQSDKPIKAILFDVGGPLVDESADFDRGQAIVAEKISMELGRKLEVSDLEIAMQSAVRSFAPSLTRAVIWHFLKPDSALTARVHKAVSAEFFAASQPVVLMDAAMAACETLSSKYILALAGNQMSNIRERLLPSGILDFFKSTLVSEDLKLQKPDTRFFLEICRIIDIAPGNCCMVGDRLDNDVFPANILGMRTIWIKSGPHAVQDPRIPEDVPDATITHMAEIIPAIEKLDVASEVN